MILTATINEVKRRVAFDNPNAVVAVKGDYEVNGVAFAFPAIYEDDFDLSTAVKTVYYKATDGIIYNHVVTDTDTDTGYPLWVFKDEINKGAYGDVEFALVCDKVENGNIVKRWVSMITAFRVQKSIEIDESEQEDNEQTYSERLAYLMTQVANMQTSVTTASESASAALTKANAVDARLNNIIIESGTSEAEVVAARTNSDTGTTYNTLGARLDTEYSEIKEDLDELGVAHINLYSGINNTLERYVNGSNGNLVYSASFQTSDYIDVSELQGQEITISYTFSGAFYDANKTYISTVGRSDSIDKQVLVPENAKYVCISCSNANESKMQIGVGISRANYVPYKYYVLDYLVTKKGDILGTTIINLFNKVNVSANTSITNNGNNTTTSGFNASGYIDIGTGEYATIYNTFNCAVYNADQSFSRMATRPYSDYPYTVKMTGDERYIRVSVRNTALDSAIVERNIGISNYVKYGNTASLDNVDADAYKMTKVYVGAACYFTTINDALNAITDASPKNRYTIFITEGTYNETVTTKDYVNLEGESRYKSVINYISDDESDYVNRSAIFASTYTTIKNLTVRTTGSKYPLHCDARYNDPYEVKCINCTFQHDGFAGESQPAGTAAGIGLYWGQHVSLEMCDCIGSGTPGVAAIYCHNSSETDAAHSRFRSLAIKNCKLSNATYGLRLQAIENNQLQENQCIYVGNKNTATTPVSLEAANYQSWHIFSIGNIPEYN